MLEFLQSLVKWLSDNGVIPREAVETDTGLDRENKTYLMLFPDDASNVVCVRQYNQKLDTDVCRDACVRYIQILVRNTNHAQAINSCESIFQFLKNRPESIEDMDANHWVLIKCTSGPLPLEKDGQGRYIYSVSFPVTTKS